VFAAGSRTIGVVDQDVIVASGANYGSLAAFYLKCLDEKMKQGYTLPVRPYILLKQSAL
jgi:hypothetical protein